MEAICIPSSRWVLSLSGLSCPRASFLETSTSLVPDGDFWLHTLLHFSLLTMLVQPFLDYEKFFPLSQTCKYFLHGMLILLSWQACDRAGISESQYFCLGSDWAGISKSRHFCLCGWAPYSSGCVCDFIFTCASPHLWNSRFHAWVRRTPHQWLLWHIRLLIPVPFSWTSQTGEESCPWSKGLLVFLTPTHPLRISIAANDYKQKHPHKFPTVPRQMCKASPVSCSRCYLYLCTPNISTLPTERMLGYLLTASFLKACHSFRVYLTWKWAMNLFPLGLLVMRNVRPLHGQSRINKLLQIL